MTREEAIKRLREYSQYAYGVYHNEQKDEEAFNMAIDALQAEPVKHGEWIVTEHCSNEYGFRKWIEIKCPFCGEKPVHEGLNNMNYCPNCGAKMDKELFG